MKKLPAFIAVLVVAFACTQNTEPTPECLLRNPIIPGFNPDPSIVAVGED